MSYSVYIIAFIVLLTSCASKSDRSVKKDSIIHHYDTLHQNCQDYIQVVNDNDRFHCLLSIQGDTLIKSEDYYFEAQFLDINEDGYKDIRVYYLSNTPNQCDNYLFQQKDKSYQLIEDCDLDIRKIKGTDFYFSYNRAGCADSNWESYLSKIELNKQVNYGYIHGKGCDSDIKEEPQVIEIYKISDTEKSGMKLIQSLPYTKHIPEFEKKWDFIENYWKQNCTKFER